MDRARGPVGPAKRLTATTPDALEEIEALIHDAHFDSADIVHDESAGTLTIPFAQEDEDWEGDEPPWELLRQTRWYDEHRVPFYAGRLTVHHVTAVDLPGFEDIWMLVGIRYDAGPGRVRINALDQIDAHVERLRVEAELTGTVALNIRRRSYRLLNAERDTIM